ETTPFVYFCIKNFFYLIVEEFISTHHLSIGSILRVSKAGDSFSPPLETKDFVSARIRTSDVSEILVPGFSNGVSSTKILPVLISDSATPRVAAKPSATTRSSSLTPAMLPLGYVPNSRQGQASI
ncbi:hypothetical protein MK292_08485, partial [Myxococcota bacterium]|nr:hypothetical protein [Myxococcota bacterium]